jgi:predicted ATP-grasp superfamily ATP-dependent carboligase
MLLRSLGWQGIAMVEYKLDTASRQLVLMEINGRFWGSLQLAIDCGVDFPNILLDAAAGQTEFPESSDYVVGLRNRWFWGDVDHLILRLKSGGAGGVGLRVRAIGGFLAGFRPGNRCQVFRGHDPSPFVRETLSWWKGE